MFCVNRRIERGKRAKDRQTGQLGGMVAQVQLQTVQRAVTAAAWGEMDVVAATEACCQRLETREQEARSCIGLRCMTKNTTSSMVATSATSMMMVMI